MTSFLDRYQQGACEEVWAELLALGEQVRTEPLYADALAVAHETMRRARANIETLIPRLRAIGYQFGYGWLEAMVDREEQGFTPEELANYPAIAADLQSLRQEAHRFPEPFVPPSPDITEQLRRIEELVGVLPLSLRAWYESVGAVNFVGTPPPTWMPLQENTLPEEGTFPTFAGDDYCLLDPLSVFPWQQASHGMRWELAHEGRITQAWLLIGTDQYNKYRMSGGGASHVTLPNPAVDAPVLLEAHHTTFVDYLRLCFRWGGFPGLEQCPGVPRRDLAYLIEGLLPV
jgi:hypothetical protein